MGIFLIAMEYQKVGMLMLYAAASDPFVLFCFCRQHSTALAIALSLIAEPWKRNQNHLGLSRNDKFTPQFYGNLSGKMENDKPSRFWAPFFPKPTCRPLEIW